MYVPLNYRSGRSRCLHSCQSLRDWHHMHWYWYLHIISHHITAPFHLSYHITEYTCTWPIRHWDMSTLNWMRSSWKAKPWIRILKTKSSGPNRRSLSLLHSFSFIWSTSLHLHWYLILGQDLSFHLLAKWDPSRPSECMIYHIHYLGEHQGRMTPQGIYKDRPWDLRFQWRWCNTHGWYVYLLTVCVAFQYTVELPRVLHRVIVLSHWQLIFVCCHLMSIGASSSVNYGVSSR